MNDLLFFSGSPLPIGTEVKRDGVNFSVFSRFASSVILELFDMPDDDSPAKSYTLNPHTNKTGDMWHVFVKGARPGILYLFRADGLFLPREGLRYNKNNFLLDPYARSLVNMKAFTGNPKIQGTPPHIDGDFTFTTTKSAEEFPKCQVTDPDTFDWHGDKPLNYPLKNCIIYEIHVKGFSHHQNSPQTHKGTYRGIIEAIPYFKELGITSLEFLPLQEFNENENPRTNPRNGTALKNYWGYSTIAFFAPKSAYAAADEGEDVLNEFKEMVRELHQAKIEVILDIVFNHTAEGNECGQTLSFRGLDNRVYYMLEDNRRYYRNYSGCGNTVNCNHPVVRNFVIHCLQYWVTEMHVDGFRFDLGSILGRDQQGNLLDNAPLLERIAEDPILRDTKIIAEAWDAGGAYQVGTFPGRWAEWNDRFRDAARLFWLGKGNARELATRITGSSDLYADDGRKPYHSINYITSHDGFTLNDLLSYNTKHNDENGEENRDGSGSEIAFNHGFEGECQNPHINRMRIRQAKNLFVTLILSVGTPMITMGDEILRTQRGNNNPYCQDNDITWLDWSLVKKNQHMFDFVRSLIDTRKNHPVFLRSDFLSGTPRGRSQQPDIEWFDSEGEPLDWNGVSHFIAYRLDGTYQETISRSGDNDFYIMFNSSAFDLTAVIPLPHGSTRWNLLLDTSWDGANAIVKEVPLENQTKYTIQAYTAVILISH